MKHLRYGRYVIRHKWFVFVAARRLGVGWLGLLHDWTKLLPVEWTPYVNRFYGGGSEDAVFERAWLHHQHWNKHHWQHWILANDDGPIVCLPMPERYAREMVADWTGAGQAITGRLNPWPWYVQNRERIRLHDDTRLFVERLMGIPT